MSTPSPATALVTGATSGIGRAIAETMATAGIVVHALGRNATALEDLRRSHGVVPITCDITDRHCVAEAIEGVEFDILVNNAGVLTSKGPFQDSDISAIDTMVDVNFSSVLWLTRSVLGSMVTRGRGHLFFTGSIAGGHPYPGLVAYGAIKAGIRMFTDGLRADLAGSGIRVTEIVPGRVETHLYHDLIGADAAEELYRGRKVVAPQDVANMVMATLAMPPHVDVARFEILPTDQYMGGGGFGGS